MLFVAESALISLLRQHNHSRLSFLTSPSTPNHVVRVLKFRAASFLPTHYTRPLLFLSPFISFSSTAADSFALSSSSPSPSSPVVIRHSFIFIQSYYTTTCTLFLAFPGRSVSVGEIGTHNIASHTASKRGTQREHPGGTRGKNTNIWEGGRNTYLGGKGWGDGRFSSFRARRCRRHGVITGLLFAIGSPDLPIGAIDSCWLPLLHVALTHRLYLLLGLSCRWQKTT
ncbi:hypothetical protein F5B17DRAFT_90213 [Nemania serpens]|nr:hypothetical protein F5B17DRAFT_90213 [Nemania serpens]